MTSPRSGSFCRALGILFCIAGTPHAVAQVTGQYTDTSSETVGSAIVFGGLQDAVGYCNSSGGDGCSVSFGSVSTTTTMDGLVYRGFADFPGPVKTGNAPYETTRFIVSGFPSNPGQNWLQSVSVNGITFKGSNVYFYGYTNGTAEWHWKTGPAFKGKASPASFTVIHAGTSGWVRPKYKIVGLTYAPPGAKSSATYISGFLSGTASSESNSFQVGINVKFSVTAGVDLFGVFDGDTTSTFSAGWSQEQDTSSSISVQQQESTGQQVPGPASSSVGVDHDYDQIYVWLNPEIFVELPKSQAVIGGYGWDTRDTITGMDVLPLTVGQLKGTQPIPSNVQARLNRTWDTALGALTSTDFQAILKADPFVANPGFNPNTDTSHRYELPESGSPPAPQDLIINFAPAPPGEQPTTTTYTSSYTSTSTSGKGAKDTYTVGYSIDGSASATFVGQLKNSLAISAQLTYANQESQTITSGKSQMANFSITPPLATDNYTGPTAIQVWKDNVYGTFMFYPEN